MLNITLQRHITRQKILNWKQSIKFPPRPRVSHEGVNLMQQLLCEPEDRIGSQASASVHRPNSLITTARRSGFVYPNVSGGRSLDGAEYLKVRAHLACPHTLLIEPSDLLMSRHIRGFEGSTLPPSISNRLLSCQTSVTLRIPSILMTIFQQRQAELICLALPESSSDQVSWLRSVLQPLAPANGAAPDATRDPILKDKVHGDRILNMRKDLAFAGFTHRSPRRFDYARVDTIYPAEDPSRERGRDPHRQSGTIGRGRALSM